MFKKLNDKGYNLMELIVVIIIIGVLIAMAAPKYLDHKRQADLAVIKNDSKVVQNVAMAEYMSTGKLPKGEQGSPEELIDNLDKQIKVNRVYKNGSVVKSKDELKKEDLIDSANTGGPEFTSDLELIDDFYLLDDAWVRANTRTALKGEFLLDSDFNTCYVAKGGFGSGGIWGGGGSGGGGNTNTQDDLIREIEKGLADLQEDADNGKPYEDEEIQKDIGKIQDNIDKVKDQDKQKELQDELDKIIVELKTGFKVKQVALGYYHSAAITEDGSLYTWGEGEDGKLGHGNSNSFDIPKIVEALEGKKVKQISLGFNHSVAVTEDGNLYTWGRGGSGQLGHGNSNSLDIPKKVEALKDVKVKQVALGNGHSAAITEDGSLYTWGYGGHGKLGHGNTSNLSTPKKVDHTTDGDPMPKVKQVALGGPHSAAITEDGSLWIWGGGEYGQLGHGDKEDRYEPTIVKDISKIKQVVLGEFHSAAITEDGDLWTWGEGWSGQLGHGNSNSLDIPKKVEALKDVKVKQVALGWKHSAAITEDGELYTWGNGGSGRLGHGDDKLDNKDRWDVPIQTVPKIVEALAGKKVKQVALRKYHSATITEDGSLYTWGNGDYGRLGYKEFNDKYQTIPKKVEKTIDGDNMPKVKQVALGRYHSAAITEDESLWTWGDGEYGKLGHGNTDQKSTPKKVEKYQTITK